MRFEKYPVLRVCVVVASLGALVFLSGCWGCPRRTTVPSAVRLGATMRSESLSGFDLAAQEAPRVYRLADVALNAEPKTITSAANPRSAGGLHDFSSEGDYWWPDPKNPDGPYIQRDGMTNPDNFVVHRQLLMEFSRNVSALAAAYKLSGDESYARAATRHLEAWFVNPETRMNPSLEYAQSIKGLHTGRGIGVIDTLHLAEVAMAVVALRGDAGRVSENPDPARTHSDYPRAFTPEIDAAVTAWFRDYLQWMRTHKYGIDESNAKNNHGTCWTLQAACFARVTRDEAVLEECRARLTQNHIPKQMAADGSFPLELARTKPYGYSIFNLDVMCALARVVSTPQKNYMTWQVSETDSRGMVKAVSYLAPYLADKTKWPLKPDVMYWNDWPVRQPALIFGAMASGNADWLALWKKLDPDSQVEEVQRNFPVRQPVLWF